MLKVHVTYLIGIYVACEVIANITAGRITQLGPFTVPAAIYIFAITFTLIDVINEALGKRGARRVVLAGVMANALLALYSLVVLAMPAPAWFAKAQSFHDVLGSTPRIVVASLLAALLSGLLDVELFAKYRRQLPPGWRVLLSNAGSTLVDSVLFIVLAFAGEPSFPIPVLLMLILGQYAVKMLITLLSIPLIFLIRAKASTEEPSIS
jgi:queuosine precursor transporter